jgi:predicted PurR-regulated permease PerM
MTSTTGDPEALRHPDTARQARLAGVDGTPGATPHDLSGLFGAPPWLRDMGTSAWLAVGVTLALAGAIWLLALTQTIVMPVITAAVIAAVAAPVVGALERRRVPRGIGSALVLLGFAAVSAGVVVVVLAGIASQEDALRAHLADARETLSGWLADLGVDRDTASAAERDGSAAVSSAVPALLEGLGNALKSLSSLVVFLSLTALSLFFMLKDAGVIRGFAERNMRVPPGVAHRMGDRVIQSLRGYFFGVTLVAAFNAVVVAIGALILGVPLAGTIAAVTFLGAFVPYLGAWGAGAFAVLIALGGAGTEAAVGMIVVQLLANGILQQMVQPIAYGAALGIHPLAVLIVTIAAGALFGAVGLILAAPLTSAATRIAADFRQARSSDGVPGAEASVAQA